MHLVSHKDGKMSHSGDNNIRINLLSVIFSPSVGFTLHRFGIYSSKKRGSETPYHALGYLYLYSYFTVTR